MNSLREFILKIEPFKLYIYLYILTLPWDFFKGIMGVSSTIMLLWWVMIAKDRGYFARLKELTKSYSIILLFLFLLYGILSLLWSDNMTYGLRHVARFKYYWITIPIIFSVFNKRDALIGLGVFVFSLGFYALLSFSIFLGFFEIGRSNSADPRGDLAYAVVTPYMAISTLLSILFAYITKEYKGLRNIFIAIFILSFIGLFTNNGRIGQVAFFVTLMILIYIHRDYFLRYKKVLLSIFLLLFVGFGVLYQKGQLDRFELGFKELSEVREHRFEGSFGYRAYMWFAAANQIQKTPLFGTGIGDNMDAFREYVKTHPTGNDAVEMSTYHNIHLDYLTKYGIVGYLIFLSSIVVLLKMLSCNKIYFSIGIIFFSISIVDSFADMLLTMKPYNNVFALFFVLLAILAKKDELALKE